MAESADSPGIILPRIDTTKTWLLLDDETPESRLIAAVAQVLGLEKDSVQLLDSFVALGGDQTTAAELRQTCMHLGIAVKIKDILRCPTLAELQTCITPFAPRALRSDHHESVMITPLDIHNATRLSARDVRDRHSRQSSRSSTSTTGNHRGSVEDTLSAHKLVHAIATTKPKAGPLEDKFVAFVTLAHTESQTPGSPPDVAMIPESQMFLAGTRVALLRKELQDSQPSDGIPDAWVVLVEMPFTGSGDIDRRRLRTWVQNMNEVTYRRVMSLNTTETLAAPSSEMERSLQRLVSKVLRVPTDEIGVNFTFAQLGGDEMTAMELVARGRHQSIYLKADEVLRDVTLGELAMRVSQRGGLAHKWDEGGLDCFDLSPMQQLYLNTGLGGDSKRRRSASTDGSYRFNQSFLLKLKKHYLLEDILAAVETVVGHHPMLRSRFAFDSGRWSQQIFPDIPGSYALNSYSVSSNSEVEAAIEQTQSTINIESGPVFAVDYFRTDDNQQMIYVAAHHLAVDLPSWRIIIHDLDELLDNGNLFSQRSMPFHKWIELQKSALLTPEDDENELRTYYSDCAFWGLANAPNTYHDAHEASFALSPELASVLQGPCNQALQTDSVDIYLATLLLSFAQTFLDRPVPVVWNQESGRDTWDPDIDISETVGWFTSLCPLAQKVEPTDDIVSVLRHLKDARRTTALRGSRFFASQFCSRQDSTRKPPSDPLEIVFSYAGSLQNLEREGGVLERMPIPGRSLASGTSDIGSSVGRIAIFEVNIVMDDGVAKIKFLYSRHLDHQDRISAWISNYEHLLLETVGRLRYHPQELTLTDVPELDVTYDGLARLNQQCVSDLKLASARDVEAVRPVTATQQEILVTQSEHPGACFLRTVDEFISPRGETIDASRLCSSWKLVTERHAALRTVFIHSVTQTGLYDQIVLRKAYPDMLFIEAAPPADPIEELESLPVAKFDTGKPPHRLTVCKTPTRTLIQVEANAAICDSKSMQALVKDLWQNYVARGTIVDPVKFSYPEYLSFLKGSRRGENLAYWGERLQNTDPCIFPGLTALDKAKRCRNVRLELDTSSADLVLMTSSQGVSAEAVIQLAWALVLRAFTGMDSPCFGWHTTGRDRAVPGLPYGVGSFANVIPCSVDFAFDGTLLSMVHNIDDKLQSSLAHQYVTVTEIQHSLRMKGTTRLFNTCLCYDGGCDFEDKTAQDWSEVEPRHVFQRHTSDCDVSLHVYHANEKVVVDLYYGILGEEQAYNLLNTLGRALDIIVSSPECRVLDAGLFTDRDYAQVISWSGETTADQNSQGRIVLQDLIAARSEGMPDSEAVCSWDGQLTYYQLIGEATKLALYLADIGVGKGAVVPVILERNRWAPVALMAVLLAGAAFVPIDAEDLDVVQPIFAKLSSSIVITGQQAAPIIDHLFEDIVIIGDELFSGLVSYDGPQAPAVTPEDIACVFFPSISADDAKGVAFTHTALATTFLAQGPAASISAHSRVMQISSFSVDVALSEIFSTLVNGGCVCIPSSRERLQNFPFAVNQMQVSWTYMTPFLARKLDPASLPTLKVVCFRTRSLDEDIFQTWSSRVKVVLTYGAPDVCPLGISFLEVANPRHLACVARPSFGSFWIINPENNRSLMPIGAVGELAIDSPTLGRSWPDRSRTPSPDDALQLGEQRKTRLFKTGHYVRYFEDGMIEFISSKHQRDYKEVDLTDVEKHARRCLGHGVDLSVETVGIESEQGFSTLVVAFVEIPGHQGDDLEHGASQLSINTREKIQVMKTLVETGLRNVVPPHLIPTIFIPVSHLPITPSLKVDRRRLHHQIESLSQEQLFALSEAASSDDAQGSDIRPIPPTENESKMLPVWASVLEVPETSIVIADGFLSAGGDRVLASKLVVACRQEGIAISIADVLRDVPLSQICRSMAVTDESDLPEHYSPRRSETQPQLESYSQVSPRTSHPIQPEDQSVAHIQHSSVSIPEVFIEKVIAPKLGVERRAVKDVAEASAVQTRSVEAGMLRGRANVDYFVFSFTGAVVAKELEEACQMLATIHPILRTAFVPYNRKVYQAIVKTSAVDFKRFYCPSWRQVNLTDRLIKQDRSAPIAFSSPMTKFMLLDGGKNSTLIMRLSKAQYDDLSVALLVRDLKTLYDENGNPPRRSTYCDFVRCAEKANAQGSEQYWKTLLDGSAMTHAVSHSKPYRLSTNVQTQRQTVVVSSLESLGISFETILKSAWAMVLAALSGTSDVVFGEIIDGRHLKLEGDNSVTTVAGPVANTIPVRVQFPDTALSPFALLQYVHEQRASGVPFENFGFMNIVEKCTVWPYWTRLSTVVQHQQRDTIISPREQKAFRLGPAACRLRVVESRAQDIYDLLVHTVPRENGKVEMAISFCADRVPTALVGQALRMLCDTVSMLTSVNIMQPIIPAGYQYRTMEKTIPKAPPLGAVDSTVPKTPESLPSYRTSPPDNSSLFQQPSVTSRLPEDQAQAIQKAISKAWSSVLHPHTLGVPEEYLQIAAFYDLWGSLIPAAQLAAQLNRSLPELHLPGLDPTSAGIVSMEDVIDHPTIVSQLAFISQKVANAGNTSCSTPPDPANQRESGASSPGFRRRQSLTTGTLSRRIRRLASSVGRPNAAAPTHPTETDNGVDAGPSGTPRLDSASLRPFINADSDVPPLPVPSPFSSIDGENEMVFAGISETGSSADSMTSGSGSSGSSQYSVTWAAAIEESEESTDSQKEGAGIAAPPKKVDMTVVTSGSQGTASGLEDLVSPLSMGSPRTGFWNRGGFRNSTPSPAPSDGGDGHSVLRRSWGSDIRPGGGRGSRVSPILERQPEGEREE